VRLPLPRLTVVTNDPEGLRPFTGIVADELNVKEVTVLDVAEAHESDFGISQRLVVNARAAGPRLGRDVQTAIKGSKTGDWSVSDDGTVTSGGLALVEGEYVVETVVDAEQAGSHTTGMLPGGGFVVLDTDVSPELEVEGAARDLVRAVQQARRDAGFDVSDRISLEVTGAEFVYRAVLGHRELVTGETLATELSVTPDLDDLDRDGDGVTEVVIGERYPARLRVTRR
jgi:isoleucyl-tRNA synthetase